MPDLRVVSETAHRTTVESSIEDIAKYLQDVLGQKLAAHVAGVSDAKTVARWASGDRHPRPENEARLRAAFHVFQLLNTEESAHTVRAWFGGLNPQLDDISPATAIREGHHRDVLVAAKAYLAGG